MTNRELTNRELLVQAVESLPERTVDQLLTWVNQIPHEPTIPAAQPALDLPEIKHNPQATPIWELAARATAELSEQDWQQLPADLASNFDAYQQSRHEC
ncbi:MAG: hypothetical protein RLZZ511_588 [Cyanobacteriota bacterium]|jgi:hypothetical protein